MLFGGEGGLFCRRLVMMVVRVFRERKMRSKGEVEGVYYGDDGCE